MKRRHYLKKTIALVACLSLAMQSFSTAVYAEDVTPAYEDSDESINALHVSPESISDENNGNESTSAGTISDTICAEHAFEKTVLLEPTCTTDGVIENRCTVCGYSYESALEAEGHQWDDGIITVKPTAANVGEKTYSCEICQKTKTEEYESCAKPVSNAKDAEDAKNTDEIEKEEKVEDEIILTKKMSSEDTLFEYEIIDDTSCRITRYLGDAEEVVIPAEIGGYQVTAIGPSFDTGVYVFEGCNNLRTVTVSEGITNLDPYAFYNCSNIRNIYLPSYMTYIGWSAFYGCTNLTRIEIPEGITEIEMDTFTNCRNLQQVVFPDSLTHIYDYAFFYCNSLNHLIIPKNVKGIGFSFFNCNALTDVEITSPDTELFELAFYQCNPNLTISCWEDSSAHIYAMKSGINYVLKTSSVETEDTPSIGNDCSIGLFTIIGNSSSIGSFSNIGNSSSVGSFSNIGSSCNIGSYTNIGSSCSIGSAVNIGSACNIGSFTNIGSACNIGSYTNIGSACNIGSYANIGSACNIGSYTNIGSACNIGSFTNIGSACNIGSYSNIGSACNIGSYSNIGSACNIGSFTNIGSSASIGSHTNIGNNTIIGTECSIGVFGSIGESCSIGSGVVVGDNVVIGSYSEIADGYVIEDGTVVDEGSRLGFDETYDVSLDGCSVSAYHTGIIDMNYYVSLPQEAVEKGYTAVLYSDGNAVEEHSFAELSPLYSYNGINSYKLTYKNIAAAQIVDQIYIEILDAKGNMAAMTSMSVSEYLQTVVQMGDNFVSNDQISLIKRLLNYGAACQTHFSYKTDQLANDCLTAEEKVSTVNLERLEAYEKESVINIDGLTYFGTSLILGSATTVRHYFTLEAGRDISEFTFFCQGEGLTAYQKGSLYYVDLPAVDISHAADQQMLMITDATNIGSIMYSVANYAIKSGKINTDEPLGKLVNSMMAYLDICMQIL